MGYSWGFFSLIFRAEVLQSVTEIQLPSCSATVIFRLEPTLISPKNGKLGLAGIFATGSAILIPPKPENRIKYREAILYSTAK